jgi:hypothetical protein
MNKNDKKVYESKRIYGDKYNKENVNVQLNRELINELKDKLTKNQTMKSYIEELIKNNLNSK